MKRRKSAAAIALLGALAFVACDVAAQNTTTRPGATPATPPRPESRPTPAAAPAPAPAPKPVASGPACADPQITAALKQASRGSTSDVGTSGLCNPDRYRGQSSMNDRVTQAFYCNDPWIGQAFQDLGYGHPQGSGGSGDCDVGRYGNGHWSGYDDLKTKIRAFRTAAAAPKPAAPVAAAPAAPAPAASAPAPSSGFRQGGSASIGADPNYGRAGAQCENAAITAALATAGRQSSTGSGRTGACDPMRYKGGQWRSQSELVQLVQQSFLCDGSGAEQPWIGQAYAELGYGAPRRRVTQGTRTIDECDPKLYGAGFGGYNDTKAKVDQYKAFEKQNATASAGAAAGAAGSAGSSASGAPGAAPSPAPAPGPIAEGSFSFGSTPAVFNSAAQELRQFAQLARDLGGAAEASQLPEAEEAAGFFGAAASLADLLANPNQLAALGGADRLADPRIGAAIVRAVTEVTNRPENVAAIRAFNAAALRSAWLQHPSGVVPLARARDRSLALITDQQLGLPDIRDLRTSIDWKKYDRVETIFLLIELGQVMKQAQSAISFVNKLSDTIEKTVDSIPGLDEIPIQNFMPAMKVVAVTSTVTEISGQVLEGAAAFVPSKLSEFYVRVNGQDRKAGMPPLTIDKDRQINLDVYITYTTYGGQIDTPWALIQLAADKLLKTKKVMAAIAKLKAKGGPVAAQLESQIAAKIKGEGYAQLKAKLQQHFTANSKTYGIAGKKIFDYIKDNSPKYTIGSTKASAEVNSDKVLFMESNSKNLLKVAQNGPNKFYLQGLADSSGKEAGYHVALKTVLLQRMVRTPGTASPNLLGTVIIKDPNAPPPRAPNAGQRCANGDGVIGPDGKCNLVQ